MMIPIIKNYFYKNLSQQILHKNIFLFAILSYGSTHIFYLMQVTNFYNLRIFITGEIEEGTGKWEMKILAQQNVFRWSV